MQSIHADRCFVSAVFICPGCGRRWEGIAGFPVGTEYSGEEIPHLCAGCDGSIPCEGCGYDFIVPGMDPDDYIKQYGHLCPGCIQTMRRRNSEE